MSTRLGALGGSQSCCRLLAPMAHVSQLLVCAALWLALAGLTNAAVSAPGGAGHALLFRDHALVKTDFKDFPTTAMTFEAWVSSSDFCHAGTIMSYAKNSKATDEAQRVADFNHFVIFDPRNLLACHDFLYIDLKPDTKNESCHASYRNVSGSDATSSYVERDGAWHHLAVTWSVEDKGLTKIYWDGLLMAMSYSGKTAPLEPGGAFMLGGEQDCFAGCTDPNQGFYGYMDEVRLWKTVRTQDEIMQHMRWASGLENNKDLAAYWKFNDPDNDNGQFRRHVVAKDSSGKGNDLSLINPPFRTDVEIKGAGGSLHTGKLEFKNNLAVDKSVKGMPEKSFTVEFWARGKALSKQQTSQERFSQLFSYAAMNGKDRDDAPDFMDDAIRIERILDDFSERLTSDHQGTLGSISVHINSNEQTDSSRAVNWIDFDAGWLDDQWHHVAVTWDFAEGTTRLYLDGEAKTPYWKDTRGVVDDKAAAEGGVDPRLAAQLTRSTTGALVLGQDQDCMGGCFTPSNAFSGDLAVLRVWDRVRSQEDIKKNMFRERPESEEGLALMYIFNAAGIKPAENGEPLAVDLGPSKNHLVLRSNPPMWSYSYAPLVTPDGTPVSAPSAGAAGYALALHDRQVLILPDFHDFPSTELTVEFWMLSVDTCRPGVPFSYAHGEYEKNDNSFLIFNYNSWGVSVMEDEGTLADHLSGISATDGNWHHIAVTWQSSTGQVILYDNGREAWRVIRGKGKTIPSGGTLVVGREQDCRGGCFDSASGAAGKISVVANQEYGPQDFFGLIEELRIWKKARSAEEIRQTMSADDGRGGASFDKPGIDKDHPDLVAYWNFNEGSGYTVKDVTNHGHNLIATQPPRWEVVRWLSTCGNGVVEGQEECDDGDARDGNGCSSSCKVEPGYTCNGNRPSRCVKGSGPAPGPRPGPAPTPGPSPSSGGGSSSSSSGGSSSGGSSGKAGKVVTAVLVPVFFVVVGALVYANRFVVYEHFPGVEAGMAAVGSALGRVVPALKPRDQRYHHLSLDPEELDISPEFLSPAPQRSPGMPGPYQPLGDGLPQ